MKLEGWDAIADYLTNTWGRTVSRWAAMRYARDAKDKLPVRRHRRRVVADKAQVMDWALRN